VVAMVVAIAVLSFGSGAYATGLMNGDQIRPGSLPANRIAPHSILRGMVEGPSVIPNPEFARLPAGARPAHNLYLNFYNFGGAGSNAVGHLSIAPNGVTGAISDSGLPVNPSLAGISFPLSS
jgi:hypothetical protein